MIDVTEIQGRGGGGGEAVDFFMDSIVDILGRR